VPRRRRGPVAAGLLAAAVAAGLAAAPVACVDLFHSTNFETLCDLDAAACASSDASAPVVDATPPPFDGNFCLWDSATARANALHACAWLGACAGPVGDNAFGPCVVNATLAYDCATNPNRPVIGAAYAFWSQLWSASSCADVRNAVLPADTNGSCSASSSAYAGCIGSTSTLLVCAADDGGASSAPASVENCAALGQTCAGAGVVAACAGAASTCSSAGTSCNGTHLDDCEDAGPFDLGVDCASFGGGRCANGACASTGDACEASAAVTCNGNVAMGCPSGFAEQVDCAALLAPTTAPPPCNAGAGGRPWDVSRACNVGSCSDVNDSCSPSGLATLSSCARGAIFSVSCTSLGFAGCALVSVPNDPTLHAACIPPSAPDGG
jgi:hypothetical protein